MAHYAFIDSDNLVTEVIFGIDENQLIDGVNPEIWYGNYRGLVCKRTSYNNKIRFNYAGIGYSYDVVRDSFIPPKCHDVASLNESTCQWVCENAEHEAKTF